MAYAEAKTAEARAGHGHGWVHVVPAPVLLGVWAALLVLTGITVGLPWAEARFGFALGAWGLWIALGIATVKGALVALYFMHLRYDRPLHAVIFVASLLFLLLFMSITLLDTLQYRPDIQQWEDAQRAREREFNLPARNR